VTTTSTRAATSVVVTQQEGTRRRRYVVDPADEHLFEHVGAGLVAGGRAETPHAVRDTREAREDHLGRFAFGCQWLRGMGRVDEMYRTLSTWEITKVERIPTHRVRG
jgi:hypothetical protein